MHERETIRLDPLFLELTWRKALLTRLRLRRSVPGDVAGMASKRAVRLAEWLHGYLTGKPEKPPEILLDWKCVSPFSRRVLTVLQTQVPAGQWISYGGLAEKCGRPKAARAVGRAMAGNPWPLLIPCHRVLGSAGQLTGFGGGLDIKLFLLKTEGVLFSPSGRAVAGR